jgi:hypothetical protein
MGVTSILNERQNGEQPELLAEFSMLAGWGR